MCSQFIFFELWGPSTIYFITYMELVAQLCIVWQILGKHMHHNTFWHNMLYIHKNVLVKNRKNEVLIYGVITTDHKDNKRLLWTTLCPLS